MEFKSITAHNYAEVATIYSEGIKSGHATFQNTVPEWANWDFDHLPFGRIVVEDGENIVGWASLAAISGRCVYKGVAEVSIYIKNEAKGKGFGTALLQELILTSEENGIWTLHSVIFPENEASLKIHYKCGFRIVGTREKIGQMNGIWRDNILMERRSKIIGI